MSHVARKPWLRGAPPTLTSRPSGRKRRLYTQPGCAIGQAPGFTFGFTNSRVTLPSATFQTLIERSLLPDTTDLPSGLKAAVKTPSRWPFSNSFSL